MRCESEGRRFKLHMRCHNCRVDTTRIVAPPRVEGAPETIDELLESAFLSSQRFTCAKCDSSIGQITAVTIPRDLEAA